MREREIMRDEENSSSLQPRMSALCVREMRMKKVHSVYRQSDAARAVVVTTIRETEISGGQVTD